ncbi:MAG TPA: TIR domain-containing protein [Bradyrhizobium sp.]|nr:TIR domain-containing protein [Bradyrhizobium sp.]
MRGKIFISYRREDAPGDARSICDRLAHKFGQANVFMDVDKVRPGQRFDRELEKALSQCDALIAVIGPRWMKLLSGHARSGERDFVHDEIAAALKRDITVIPTLVGRKGHMPSLPHEDNLPEDIRALVLHQRQDIAHESFGRDSDELVEAIKFVRRGGRHAGPWRTMAISGAIALVLAMGLLGYWLDMTVLPKAGSNIPQPTIFTAQSNSDAARAAADEAAKNKAVEEEASRKATEARGQAEADAAKKKAEEDARRQAEADAAKKQAEEDARRQTEADAARKKAEEDARRQAEPDAAKKKAREEAAGKRAAADCDRLAASPFDMTRPSGVAGVDFAKIDAIAATPACDEAMQRDPDIVRFVYQAGRAAQARKDYIKAAELYRAGIAKGSTASMNNLGILYCRGEGVSQDYGEARTWFEKAAALDNTYAMNSLAELYYYGRGVTQDYAEARKWSERAAALGDATAMYNLAALYENGYGVTPDREEARKWYQKAANAGDQDANEKLKTFN